MERHLTLDTNNTELIMSDLKKLPLTSMDILEEQQRKLKELFPEVFTEGNKIDWNKLKLTLGEQVDVGKERYGMNWPGKSDCFKSIQKPSTGTLVPCPEESVDFDSTENLFIEGDNLEVLKLLQKSYLGKVKMIYIDPPYNTGHDFIYPDDFSESLDTYLSYTGQLDENGRKFSTNTDTDGRFHSNWMSMMYPRLFLAKNLLREDGVIFISINDNEAHNLRKICDEIFGEENFVTQLVWEKKKKGTFLSNTITSVKEYIFVYAKYKCEFNGLIGEINSSQETYPCVNASNKKDLRRIPSGIISKYREKNHFLPKGSTISATTMSLTLHSDLVIKEGVLAEELIIEGNWRYRQDLMVKYAENGELYITQDLYLRRIVNEPRKKTLKDLLPRVGGDEDSSHKSLDINDLFSDGWGSNEDGEEELRQLLEGKNLMDFPKPRKLIEKLCVSIRDNDAVIVDFFAGSATTAHAVMHLNSLDNGNRKFIMVQLPELCDKKSEAYKAGYKTIADIGKERIRRVSGKIKKGQNTAQGDLLEQEKPPLDLGFKVFKLSKSNFNTWNSEVEKTPEAIQEQLELHVDHIDPASSQESILYEILLKSGFGLTTSIEKIALAGKTVFSIEDGALLICLSISYWDF